MSIAHATLFAAIGLSARVVGQFLGCVSGPQEEVVDGAFVGGNPRVSCEGQ